MKLDRMIQMVINMLLRRATNAAITKGIDMAAGKGKPAHEMTPEERRMAQQARKTAKMARQATRLTRRF